MAITSIDDKVVDAIIPVTFDFSNSNVISAMENVNLTIMVISGVDPAASDMKLAGPEIQGMSATFLMRNGVAGAKYLYTVSAMDGQKKDILACYQRVRNLI